MTRIGLSAEAVTALTSTSKILTINDDTTTDTTAEPVPDRCRLAYLHFAIDTIAASASALSVYLSEDSAGDHPLTETVSCPITTGKTTATDGGAVLALDAMPFRRSSIGTKGAIYAIVATNTGTCNATARLVWEQD